MFNILTYVWVASATADVHVILEVPATDKIHIDIDTKSHAFGVRLTLFDPISRNHAIQTKYHSFFFKYYNSRKIF